jgi:hypothetical protein
LDRRLRHRKAVDRHAKKRHYCTLALCLVLHLVLLAAIIISFHRLWLFSILLGLFFGGITVLVFYQDSRNRSDQLALLNDLASLCQKEDTWLRRRGLSLSVQSHISTPLADGTGAHLVFCQVPPMATAVVDYTVTALAGMAEDCEVQA